MLSADRTDNRRIYDYTAVLMLKSGRTYRRARAQLHLRRPSSARARPGSSRAKTTNSAARSSLHYAGTNAAKIPPALVRSMSMFAIGRL